jgi:hypothetical protein
MSSDVRKRVKWDVTDMVETALNNSKQPTCVLSTETSAVAAISFCSGEHAIAST